MMITDGLKRGRYQDSAIESRRSEQRQERTASRSVVVATLAWYCCRRVGRHGLCLCHLRFRAKTSTRDEMTRKKIETDRGSRFEEATINLNVETDLARRLGTPSLITKRRDSGRDNFGGGTQNKIF